MSSAPRGALEGIRVIDLSPVMLGPFCTQVLGDMGAEVIKVEPPGGDINRWTGASKTPGMSAAFMGKSRNKRSVVLNLKQPDARAVLARLSGEFSKDAEALEKQVHELAGENFNLGSPKQIGEILFGKLGLQGGKKTATGAWSTDSQVMEDLAADGVELCHYRLDDRRVKDWLAASAKGR